MIEIIKKKKTSMPNQDNLTTTSRVSFSYDCCWLLLTVVDCCWLLRSIFSIGLISIRTYFHSDQFLGAISAVLETMEKNELLRTKRIISQNLWATRPTFGFTPLPPPSSFSAIHSMTRCIRVKDLGWARSLTDQRMSKFIWFIFLPFQNLLTSWFHFCQAVGCNCLIPLCNF